MKFFAPLTILALLAGIGLHAQSATPAPAAATVAPAIDPAVFSFTEYEKIGNGRQAYAAAQQAFALGRKKNEAADARSDAAWEKAFPIVKEWEKKGRPYIPWAAKPDDLPQANIPAFPGAEGGGMFAFGGRGGRVLVVTNLNDSGPGSFREACETGGPRIIVFNVAGIIHLKERVRIRAPYVTIAGNTAPGDGVCIADNTVAIDTHDVVIRHMRFRRGDPWVGDFDDALGGNAVGNIMIDHVSCSWALDENLSIYRHMYQPPDGSQALKLPSVNISIQNSIISESIAKNGSTIGGLNSTFQRNLWACNTGRNPSIGMYGDFTFVNNVLYNWRDRSVDGGDEKSYYTIINNYYKPGPMTPRDEPTAYRILKAEAKRGKPIEDIYGKAYVAGNFVEKNPKVTANNWDGGVQITPVTKDADIAKLLAGLRTDKPWPHAPLTIMTAPAAYEYVLANSGATLPRRDAVDRRVIEMTRAGTVTFGTGIIRNISEVGGFPTYKGEPRADSDGDGMPDAWEIAHGLNPNDACDANADLNGDGYANIEDYINGLNPRAPRIDWTDLHNNRDPHDPLMPQAQR